MSEETFEPAVVRALQVFGKHPVALEMDVAALFSLIATIQLACRHPHFNGSTRKWVEGFARSLQEEIAQFSPDLGSAIELGWQKEYDIPVDVPIGAHPERKCRVCGCTEERACPGGCHWVEENLCSACEPAVRSLIVP